MKDYDEDSRCLDERQSEPGWWELVPVREQSNITSELRPEPIEVGADVFPTLQGTHMRETKYAVIGGCETMGVHSFYWE